MPYIPEILIPPFICALILALVLSIYSIFVVVKRWAFLSVGVSHAAFGGVALGYMMGVSPEISAGLFAAIAGLLIAFSHRRGNLSEDASTGVIFSTFMALGVVLFSISKTYMSDVFSYLFGNMLAVGWRDVWLSMGVAAVSFAFLLAFKRGLFLSIIDEELAHTCGVPVVPLYYGLVLLFTTSVVISIKLLGVVLVSCLTVIPASVGFAFSSRIGGIIAISVATGILVVLAGMLISYATDLPPGATTALVGGFVFTLSLLKR